MWFLLWMIEQTRIGGMHHGAVLVLTLFHVCMEQSYKDSTMVVLLRLNMCSPSSLINEEKGAGFNQANTPS
jgi:hypothetical protein